MKKCLITKTLLMTILSSNLVSNIGLAQKINIKNLMDQAVSINLLKNNSYILKQEDRTPTEPTRKVNAKVRIRKLSFIQNGTHSESKVEEVCEITQKINVFDIRGIENYNLDYGDHFICKSTVENKTIEIHVLGLELIGKQTLFLSEPKVDLKHFAAGLFLTGSKISNVQFNFKYFESKDLNLSSGILSLIPDLGLTCTDQGNCSAAIPEAFSATIEFQDIVE